MGSSSALVTAGLAALVFGASAAPAQTPVKYRVDVRGEQVVDLSVLKQPEQHQSFTLTSFLSATVRDTAGGRAVVFQLDSMVLDSASPLPKALADSARGSSWRGALSPEMRISNLTASPRSPAAAQLDGLLAAFFPRVKPNVRPGDGWTDTLDFKTGDLSASFTVHTVTNYSATGTEERNGVTAVKVTGAFSANRSGTLTNAQGPLSISGTGTGTSVSYIAPDGRFLGGETVDRANLSLVGSFAPSPIPVTSSTTTTVTVLP